jgi:aryl-alcohol dehydrogenase-like predicted oxidoreductase
MNWTRRVLLKLGLGTFATSALGRFPELFAQSPVITRAIPSSGERIPVVGIGTRDFSSDPPELGAALKNVLGQFPDLGGRVIDTATGYQRGSSETVIGELIFELGNRDRLFLATKVNADNKQEGLLQIERSFQRLRTDRLDLIAVHNLSDTETQLATLRDMKQAGRIRYLGITTSSERQYDEFERIVRTETMDFVQLDYAVDNRAAGDRLLPLAADRGFAVMVNLPFGRRRLFRKVLNLPLPDWASEIDCTSWAQIFLKYIVSHPAVTCAIPGTRSVSHLVDNMQAARGRLPDTAMRLRMEQHMDRL